MRHFVGGCRLTFSGFHSLLACVEFKHFDNLNRKQLMAKLPLSSKLNS